MRYICSLIAVSDIQRSKEFYENILEQKVKYDFGENITFHGDFAIHLSSHFQKLIDNKPITYGGNNFELYFENDHPEKIAEKLKSTGAKFVHEIREQPWRQRVMRFYDPDENIIEIGESLEYLAFRLFKEGLSVKNINNITLLPENFIEASIIKYNIKP